MSGATSIQELMRQATDRLAAISDSPRLDAELLLAQALGTQRTALHARPSDPVAPAVLAAFEASVTRRLGREPVAYITGHKEFWSLDLEVGPAVLVPRPETELLVERALQSMPHSASRVLDLGTGSGAIALAIAKERPQCMVVASDVSESALDIARRNASRHALQNITFCRSDWYDELPHERFDLIVTNPPYVAAADPHLPALIREPLLALSPGTTGLEAIERIAAGAPGFLGEHGTLLLEHGSEQSASVKSLLTRAGFGNLCAFRDNAGAWRVIRATLATRTL